GCGALTASDITDVDPLLGPLQNNGGNTDTHALKVGSPAIDAGSGPISPFPCADADQRGVTPRVDQPGVGTQICDIGAYEFPGVPVPAITIDGSSVVEGNSTTTLVFTVSLSAQIGTEVTVDYSTADGEATTIDMDYTAASGTLTFPANDTSETISINVTGDTTAEPDETFTVNLSNANWATISTGSATGTIENDDGVPESSDFLTFLPIIFK
ncbi:MAG: choice-of-anchor Q domain-containing protein, partial [Anaerolineae bacterium]|nr:choice-of-anchor Q domain-containing protein [Anaerolineae bacterium]